MRLIFGVALAGGAVAIGFYWYKFCTFKECYVLADIEKWGQTGDFFGGVLNPFFTLVGLFFVIVTIQQNQQALKQNEIELQLSREELKKSSDALQSQVITAEKKRFKTTFFQIYNCLLYENAKFLQLVKKYDLLECLEDSTLADSAHRALLNSVPGSRGCESQLG